MDLKLTRQWLGQEIETADAQKPPVQIDTISSEVQAWKKHFNSQRAPIFSAGIKPCDEEVK